MAIYIEEEKKRGGRGLFGFGILFVVLIIIGVTVYYMFFVQPELIDSVVPIKSPLGKVVRIDIDLEGVVKGHFFDIHRQYVPAHTPKSAGNSLPFGVF